MPNPHPNTSGLNKPGHTRRPKSFKVCPATRRQLADMFYVKGMTLIQICTELGVSDLTARRWMDKFQIDRTKRYVDPNTLVDARMNIDGQIEWDETETSLNGEAEPSTQGDETALAVNGPSHNDLEPIDPQTPWLALSPAQRKAVVIMAGSQSDELNWTNETLAQDCGVTVQTVRDWRKQPTFQSAVLAMKINDARFEGSMVWWNDMLKRYRDNTTSRDDRILMAKALGITDDGPRMNVNQTFVYGDVSLKARY